VPEAAREASALQAREEIEEEKEENEEAPLEKGAAEASLLDEELRSIPTPGRRVSLA